jgi:hypothetical protein
VDAGGARGEELAAGDGPGAEARVAALVTPASAEGCDQAHAQDTLAPSPSPRRRSRAHPHAADLPGPGPPSSPIISPGPPISQPTRPPGPAAAPDPYATASRASKILGSDRRRCCFALGAIVSAEPSRTRCSLGTKCKRRGSGAGRDRSRGEAVVAAWSASPCKSTAGTAEGRKASVVWDVTRRITSETTGALECRPGRRERAGVRRETPPGVPRFGERRRSGASVAFHPQAAPGDRCGRGARGCCFRRTAAVSTCALAARPLGASCWDRQYARLSLRSNALRSSRTDAPRRVAFSSTAA